LPFHATENIEDFNVTRHRRSHDLGPEIFLSLTLWAFVRRQFPLKSFLTKSIIDRPQNAPQKLLSRAAFLLLWQQTAELYEIQLTVNGVCPSSRPINLKPEKSLVLC
jgi:hypothetical protein